MDTEDRRIYLELDEHDALRLLALVLKNTHQAHNPWRPYWQNLAEKLERCLERSNYAPFECGEKEVDLFRFTRSRSSLKANLISRVQPKE